MKTTRCCTICKNHGQKVSITSHVCPFTECQCSLCQLTRLSRRVMCHQQRFWRHKKLDNKGSSTPDDGAETAAHSPEAGQVEEATEAKVAKQKRTKRDVVCDRCRNHNQWKQKRGHKGQCPFENCECSYCSFTSRRQQLMKHQQRVRRAMVSTPGPHDNTEMTMVQLSKEVLDLSSHLPSSEHVSSTMSLTSTIPMSSSSGSFSPNSSSSTSTTPSLSYSSIPLTSTGPQVSSISPSFTTSYSSIPFPSTSLSLASYQGNTVNAENHSPYQPTPPKPSLQDMREKITGDRATHTRSLPLSHSAICTNSTFLPLPGATTPPLPVTNFTQRELDPSNAHDPKEKTDPYRTPHSSPHLVTQELEALHMREEREILPGRSASFPSGNHKVLRPQPIGRSWLPPHTLYPEWNTYSAPCHPPHPPHPPPPPPPPPAPPSLPSSYGLHALSDKRIVAAQTHVPSLYPGAWCLRCCLQEAYVHTRSYSDPLTHANHLPTLPSTSTNPFPTAVSKESVFCGSRFILDTNVSQTFTSYK
ncbi:doublesex- and mab-3-related transcription factor B1-like [Portunus trituberculatus]|uniref:doublesex- and mab-3-related transcription factor B1-like n=1 Tax=Portunus trituberculatus TaxID=210409 RepID=UPI001E1D0F4A|nr:doublesex- and mab-3-related transcription factor B1-like [Portunus trituberculatus]